VDGTTTKAGQEELSKPEEVVVVEPEDGNHSGMHSRLSVHCVTRNTSHSLSLIFMILLKQTSSSLHKISYYQDDYLCCSDGYLQQEAWNLDAINWLMLICCE
jgi:hypothetical protein